jgi:WD40 repeat protein
MIRSEKIVQLQSHSAALYALAPGRKVNTLFSAGADKVVAEWNLETFETNPFAIRTEHTVYSLLNLNNTHLVIGTIHGSMHIIDLNSKQEIRHLKFHNAGVFHMIEIPNQNEVVAACSDGSISVWNENEWSLTRHLSLSREKIRRLAVNPSQTLLAVACGDGSVYILESSGYKIVEKLDAHVDGANSVYFTTDDTLITGGKDAHLKQWSILDGGIQLDSVPAHNYAIYDIVGHNQWIATASRDKTVKLWELNNLQSPTRLDRAKAGGHINSVNAALWLENEQLLATCGDDRSIILWRIKL